MLGWLLAASLMVHCTVTNFDPQPTLACTDGSTWSIPYSDWPKNWHGPELGFTYTVLDLGNGEFQSVRSNPDERALATAVQKSRAEQRRWHQNRHIREGKDQ